MRASGFGCSILSVGLVLIGLVGGVLIGLVI